MSFFFSSRRRHTRSLCDWSSDVCSSDLGRAQGSSNPQATWRVTAKLECTELVRLVAAISIARPRSEERRVGKECRCRWSPDAVKKKESVTEGARRVASETDDCGM